MKELFRTAPKQQNYVELKAGENSNSLSFLKIATEEDLMSARWRARKSQCLFPQHQK